MPIQEVLENGRARFSCPECGRDFEADYQEPSDGFREVMLGVYERMICKACQDRHAADEEAEKAAQRKQALIATLDERMARAGFQERFQRLEKPYVRSSAVWFWKNRFSSLLASGATGTGKTSGAAFVIREMMKDSRPRVMYRTWQMLQAEFVKAKTSDGDNEFYFFERLDSFDYIVIDELIGKRGEATRLSPSGQDLLFNIIDGAYSMARRAKVWILGNFYDGAIDRLIDDPLPTRRRLQESFKLAWFEHGKPVDESIRIFDESELIANN